MAKASDTTKKKQRSGKTGSDIYTAMLGLAVLVLAATATYVCMRSQEFYGQIFEFVSK